MCLKEWYTDEKPCDLSILAWHIATDHGLCYYKYRLIYEHESKERINNANICRSNKGVGLIKLLLQKQFLTFNSINLQTNIQRPFSNGWVVWFWRYTLKLTLYT